MHRWQQKLVREAHPTGDISGGEFYAHHQRQSVRKAHPTGDVSGGAFYAPPAAEIGARSPPYG
jgi:hypothetical protein